MKLYAIPLGFVEHHKSIPISGKSGAIVSPILAYLIEPSGKLILYDGGAYPDVMEHHNNCWKGLTKLFKPTIEASYHIVERFREISLRPDDISVPYVRMKALAVL